MATQSWGKTNQTRPDTEDVTLGRGAEKEPMHPKEQILPEILARSAEMLHNEQTILHLIIARKAGRVKPGRTENHEITTEAQGPWIDLG